MRRLIHLAVLLAVALPSAAQVPATVSFQGFLTDTGGIPLTTQTDLTFTLYDTTDASVWMETHLNADVEDGVFSVRLGSLSSLSQIPFDQPYEIGIKVGDDDEMTPRTPFDAVPYALSGSCPECPEPTCADVGLDMCPSGCTDLQVDESNCGSCGTTCAAGERCFTGSCFLSCGAGSTNCSGVCRDLSSDRANCGACGYTCPAGQICQGSSCVLSCGGGLTNCSGVCRDLQTDENHCGSCGNACSTGQFCIGGSCS